MYKLDAYNLYLCKQGETQRVMRHFHFTTWPDFGVPNPPHTLVRFVRAFRERIGPDQRPIVVHCRLVKISLFATFQCIKIVIRNNSFQLNFSNRLDNIVIKDT